MMSPEAVGADADLRIVVSEASTVFSGAATLHRFDAPTAREIGSAVRSILGPDPHGASVHITADSGTLHDIGAVLDGYDIELRTTERVTQGVLDDVDLETPKHQGDIALPRRAELFRRGAWDAQEWGDDRKAVWIIAGAVAVVVCICAGVVAATARSLNGQPVHTPAATSVSAAEQATTATKTAPSATQVRIGAEGEASASDKPPVVVHERAGVRVELPAGFVLEPDGDTWRAVGPDPDFRLHIAVDELYTLPPETMAEQVKRDVDEDPQTEMVATDGYVLTYRELPGDGSEVLWKTWPHGTKQIFIACHTRQAPTRVQAATCRMAMDSATFDVAGRGDIGG